jgi:hypothetical protein
MAFGKGKEIPIELKGEVFLSFRLIFQKEFDKVRTLHETHVNQVRPWKR